MFRHCVMFKWKPETTAEARAVLFEKLDGLAALPFVKAFAHGPDAGLREGNWDHVVVADFESREDYLTYASYPMHLDLIQGHLLPAISARAAVQYAFQP
ncbi:MAG: Dabb family protein [Gammaproteobacteria bacterium]|nr:Dabb family protein [Gammaproteobacteria bacterium]